KVGTTGSDSISAPVTCTADQFQTTDTTGADFHGSCTNDAGLTTNATTLTVKRDHTNPTVTLEFARSPDHNGWYTRSVGIKRHRTDDTSGIATCEDSPYSGLDSASASVTRSCTDNAGNSGSATGTFKFDSTGPSANLAATAGTLGTNGWYTSDITLSTTGTDTVSSPVTCTADQYQTTETTGATFNGSCTNDAGLTTNEAPFTVKLYRAGPAG